MRITIQNQGQFQKIQKKGVKEIVAERKSTLGQLSEKLCSNEGWSSFITQAVRPGFKFRLCFFFFPRSVTNRHLVSKVHASTVHVYSTWNLQKLSS